MTVKGLDTGTVMKKTTSQKIWKGKTSSQIAKEIAHSYGMEAEVVDTKHVWDNMPQGNKSDVAFLKYLASREEGGNFVCYIRGNTLYYTTRNLSEASKVTFEYGWGDGKLVSFEPTTKESGKKPTSIKASASHVNPLTGDVEKEDVDNKTEAKTGATGNYRVYYGEDGTEAARKKGKDTSKESSLGKPVVQPVKDKKEAKNLINSRKKEGSLKEITAKLTIEGNPLVTPNVMITIKNVAKRHLGNWYVTKVSHRISNSAYITVLDMCRNATKSKGKGNEKATDANNTVGGSKVNEQVKVRVYAGEDGKFLGYSSQSSTIKKK